MVHKADASDQVTDLKTLVHLKRGLSHESSPASSWRGSAVDRPLRERIGSCPCPSPCMARRFRWPAVTVGAIAAALLLAYFVARPIRSTLIVVTPVSTEDLPPSVPS